MRQCPEGRGNCPGLGGKNVLLAGEELRGKRYPRAGGGSRSGAAITRRCGTTPLRRKRIVISRPASGKWGGQCPSTGLAPPPLVALRRAQPERDLRRLHRLLHHREQPLPHLRQVHLIAHGGAERRQRARRVILAPIE